MFWVKKKVLNFAFKNESNPRWLFLCHDYWDDDDDDDDDDAGDDDGDDDDGGGGGCGGGGGGDGDDDYDDSDVDDDDDRPKQLKQRSDLNSWHETTGATVKIWC